MADASQLRIAVITCSSTRTLADDEAGAELVRLIGEAGWTCQGHIVVPDDIQAISESIVHYADVEAADVILTCGGTGLSPRDVTPEATKEVCERDVPGIAEVMRSYSLQFTPLAALSRGVSMMRAKTLVINLPGSTKAARENWEAIKGVLEHAKAMAEGQGHHHS